MGRVLFLADVHGNVQALEEVLATVGPADRDRIVCLGDVVGYGPDPGACVERLRDRGAEVIMGNHDAAVVGEIDENRFNPLAREAVRWTRERLGDEHHAFLRSLPTSLKEERYECFHGSPRSPLTEYLHGESMARLAAHRMTRDWLFVGHTHIPALYRGTSADALEQKRIPSDSAVSLDSTSEYTILNPGSVGQPRDGNPDASALVVDVRKATARWYRVPYPIETVQERMREANLPDPLIQRLRHGT